METCAMPNPVIHFEIGCRDKATTATFYRSLFDWPIAEGENPHALDIPAAPGGIAGHITALGHEPHHYLLVYIEVVDVAATLAKATSLGGQPLVGPVKLPDGRAFAWFKDPDGTTLGLISPK